MDVSTRKQVFREKEAHLIAGAAGVAACLGADFVKLHPPAATKEASSAPAFKISS